MLGSRNINPKTIVLKSPDSDKVREVIITSVLLPKSTNENNRTAFIKHFKKCENNSITMDGRPCKRRLEHLSIEQKILRKKLKNREAAQTSRDRKKARLEELEASLLKLQNENESLYEEVLSLREDKESLSRENSRLNEEVWKLSVAGGTGPAASRPLPKGECPLPALRHPPPRQPQRLCNMLLLLLALMTMTGTGLMRCPSLLLLKNLNVLQTHSLQKLMTHKSQKHRKKAWWGRQQKAWNPVGPALKMLKRN